MFQIKTSEKEYLDRLGSMELSPDWSKNIRDVDGIEFIALSRKEQNRLRLVRKKATVSRKVSTGCPKKRVK